MSEASLVPRKIVLELSAMILVPRKNVPVLVAVLLLFGMLDPRLESVQDVLPVQVLSVYQSETRFVQLKLTVVENLTLHRGHPTSSLCHVMSEKER